MLKSFFTSKKTFLFVFVIYTLLLFKAFFSFNPSFDYLWYHLPISLTIFKQTTYLLTGFEQALFEGSPPLAHYVQGALVIATGLLHLGNAINFIGFATIFYLLWHLRKQNFYALSFSLSMLAIPIFVAQLSCGFIDVWANLWLFLAFAAYFDLLQQGLNKLNIGYFFIGAAFAILSKFQMWPIVGTLCLFMAYELIRQKRLKGVFLTMALALLVSLWPAHNLIKYGNPTHPYASPGLNFLNSKSARSVQISQYAPLQLYEGFLSLPRPILFLMSAFEVTRLFPTEHGMQWTYEQWTIGETKNPNYRMGGWSFLTVGLFLLASYLAFQKGLIPKKFMLAFLLSIILVSFLPQSYELRYFLFIPFVGAFIMSEFLATQSGKSFLWWRGLLIFSVILVACSRALLPYTIHSVNDYVTESEREFWKNTPANSKENPLCIDDKPDRILFWAGPQFNSIWVKKCTK